jgi:hydrogenase maturation protease
VNTFLIIGYGNPLRQDDGLGWQAANHLAKQLEGKPVDVIACHQLMPELAESAQGARAVLFIDARHDGTPGELSSQDVENLKPLGSPLVHFMDPSAVMHYAQEFYGHCPPAKVLSMAGASFDYGEGLSAPVQEALPKLFQWVNDWIQTGEGGTYA